MTKTKVEEVVKEMTILKQQHLKQMQDLQAKNEMLEKKLKDAEQKAQLANDEFKQKMKEFAKDIGTLQKQQKQATINSNQMKLDTLWSYLKKMSFGIYLLLTSKKVNNSSEGNFWHDEFTSEEVTISPDGQNASNPGRGWLNVFAKQGFPLAEEVAREDHFPGTILYYYEVVQTCPSKWGFYVGLSDKSIPDGSCVGWSPNSYAIINGCNFCLLSGKQHDFEWPTGCIEPKWDGQGDVYGCGLVLSPEDELSIFFTGNGILMGRQIPLNDYSGDTLYPTVGIFDVILEANFGDNTAKPFKFDIHHGPGLIFN